MENEQMFADYSLLSIKYSVILIYVISILNHNRKIKCFVLYVEKCYEFYFR